MNYDAQLTSAYLGGHVHVITVEGELDVATAPRLRNELLRVDQEGAQEIVVDLLKVSFVESVALGILAEASKRTKARGGTFRVVCDDRRIARIIEITGLHRVLWLHSNLREALESLGGQGLASAAT